MITKKIGGKDYIFITQVNNEYAKMIKSMAKRDTISFRMFKDIPLIQNKAHYIEPNEQVISVYITDTFRRTKDKFDVAEYFNDKPTGNIYKSITHLEFEYLTEYNEKLTYKMI